MSFSHYESAGIGTVPMFLTAKSPKRLRRLMFRNNLKNKGFVVYQDIQYVASEKLWYAWYYVDVDKERVDGND